MLKKMNLNEIPCTEGHILWVWEDELMPLLLLDYNDILS